MAYKEIELTKEEQEGLIEIAKRLDCDFRSDYFEVFVSGYEKKARVRRYIGEPEDNGHFRFLLENI